MFNDTDDGQTQYCPACLEWSEKYEKLKAENEKLLKELQYKYEEMDAKDFLLMEEDLNFWKNLKSENVRLKSENHALRQCIKDINIVRLSEKYEQYKQALEKVRDRFNCFRSCMIPFHIGNSEELPHRMADIIQEHCNNIIQKINEVLKDDDRD